MADLQEKPEHQELAALHALGALGQHEARAHEIALQASLSGSDSSLDVFERVVELLGHAPLEVAPAPSVRATLLGELAPQTRPTRPEGIEESESQPRFSTILASEGEWKEISKGVEIKELLVNPERSTMTFLLRIQPGAKAPAHRHPAIEELFVIEGDCRVNSEVLRPGDYRCAQAGSADRILTSESGTTVLVFGPIDYEFL